MNFTFEHIFAKATASAINNTDWMFLMEHKEDMKEPVYYRNDMKYDEVYAYMELFEEMNKEQNPIVLEFPKENEEKEYTWPDDWSWKDDILSF